MRPTSIYPVLMTHDVATTAAFYRDWLGFEDTFTADWYVSLRRGPWELAVLDAGHATIPTGHGRPAGGVLLNLEVEDVDAEHRRLVVEGGLPEALPLRTEAFGQRHFILTAPDGVLVDVITEVEPDASYAEAFVDPPGTDGA